MDPVASMQPTVTPGRLIVAVGIPKCIGPPCQQRKSIPNSLSQDLRAGKAGKVEIAGEIVDELLHSYMIAAP